MTRPEEVRLGQRDLPGRLRAGHLGPPRRARGRGRGMGRAGELRRGEERALKVMGSRDTSARRWRCQGRQGP